jgi:D-alanyl-D-alanine dipeptidase
MRKIILISIGVLLCACVEKTSAPAASKEPHQSNGLSGADPREHFVSLADVIDGIHLDIRYYGENNFIGKRIDGYKAPKALITKEAAQALAKVQEELKAYGLGILVYDAYRPQRAVDHFVSWAKDQTDTLMKASYYPNVAKANLFKEDYIAARSGHSRGSTLDMTLVDLESGALLDMGSNYDFFGKASWPNHPDISKEQRAHRMLLQQLMTKHDFVPYPKEWWHFTLKDEPFPETYFDFVVE